MRMNDRQTKLKKELTIKQPVQTALLNAGYSANVARQGMAGIPKRVLNALGKEGLQFAEIGKAIDPQTQENLVRGMLAFNVMHREDKGVLSAKALGSDRRVNMFTPDVQTGIIVISAPTVAGEDKAKLLESGEE